jgi:hypothetical protein
VKYLALLCLMASGSFAADVTVGTDYPDLQTALDKAPCGSRILVPPGTYLGSVNGSFQFRQNCLANPMTVTTTMYAWLPTSGTRITPSYLYGAGGPLLPRLQGLSRGNAPALVSNLNSASQPPNGWSFRGLAFEPSLPGGSVSTLCPAGTLFNALVNFGGIGWPYVASGIAQLPTNIAFDQVIVRGGTGRANTTVCSIVGIRIAGTNITVSNSFLHDIVHEYQDTYAIGAQTGAAHVTIYNNYENAASESGLLTSGGPADYPDPQYTNFNITYNYWVKSYKWWGGTNGDGHTRNPHGPTLAAGTAGDWVTGYGVELNSTLKNLIEFKSINGATIRYNVGELSPGDYVGQRYGICATPRSSMQWYPKGVKDASGTPIRLTTSGTTFSWTGTTYVWGSWDASGNRTGGSVFPLRVGQTLCLSSKIPGSQDNTNECRSIASLDSANQTGTVAIPWNTATTTGTDYWWQVGFDNAWFKDVTFENNVFKNVATPYQYLASTPVSLEARNAGAGRIRNYVVRNNLTWNTIPMSNNVGGHITINEEGDSNPGPDGSRSFVGHIFSHNTEYRVAAAGPNGNTLNFSSGTESIASNIPRAQGLRITDNIFHDSTWGIAGDGLYGAPASKTLNTFAQPDYVAKNNQLAGDYGTFEGNSGCNGTCSGNISARAASAHYLDAAAGNFKIKPGSLWYKAGTDGRDLGVDFDQLPLLKNVRVTVGTQDATIDFDLSATNKDVPVVLEVSPTTASFGGSVAYPCLTSTLCPYVVVPSLDPTLFKQPDSSERTNPKLPPVAHDGLHRSWPICWRDTVNDDRTGTPRDLSCKPNTVYYYRLMAGGDTVWGSFTTSSIVTADSFTAQRNLGEPAQSLRVNWGSRWLGLDQQTTVLPAAGRASASVPVAADQSLWVQVQQLDSSGKVLVTEPLRLIPH